MHTYLSNCDRKDDSIHFTADLHSDCYCDSNHGWREVLQTVGDWAISDQQEEQASRSKGYEETYNGK